MPTTHSNPCRPPVPTHADQPGYHAPLLLPVDLGLHVPEGLLVAQETPPPQGLLGEPGVVPGDAVFPVLVGQRVGEHESGEDLAVLQQAPDPGTKREQVKGILAKGRAGQLEAGRAVANLFKGRVPQPPARRVPRKRPC